MADENCFPSDFIIGVGSSAYQVEGSPTADGKGESIIDHFVHTRPTDACADGSNGDVACDSYKLFKQDNVLLENLGVDFYRFSISWPRILPTGDVANINQAGIRHYNDIIDDLLAKGIQPMVTIYHFDLPQALQDMGGWLNPHIADYYQDYAQILFEKFGDRVKYWGTINEPRLSSGFGYGRSRTPEEHRLAPGLEMQGVGEYMACHTMLLAHAKAYHLYNNHYRETQKGQIGIEIDAFYYKPATNSVEDKEATERAMTFGLRYILHPIFSQEGDYPPQMKKRIAENSKSEGRFRSRLPSFTSEEIKMLKGSSDFLGINHYTTYITKNDETAGAVPSHIRDTGAVTIPDPANKTLKYPPWLAVEPEGMRDILLWIKTNYGNPPVIITENGVGDPNPTEDSHRISYHKAYLKQILKAIKEDRCNVRGYGVWSLLDSYEWSSGYTPKFGLYHVDFENQARTRTPKKSVQFFKEFMKNKCFSDS